MKTTIRFGALLKCDADVGGTRCGEVFRTNSMSSLVRAQARRAGWNRVAAWQVPDGHNGSRLHDVCASHAAVAADLKSKRAWALAKEREKKKAEKKTELEGARAKREAARAQKQADKLATEAERAKRKADHAARKAQLAATREARRQKRAAKKEAR